MKLDQELKGRAIRKIDHSHLFADHRYHLIFTHNTTHSLKIIAESIQWNQQAGHFCFLRQSHSSIIGMRDYVRNDRVHGLDVEELESRSSMKSSLNEDFSNFNVFVFPAQCNFTGQHFPLRWITDVKNGCLADIVENDFPWIVVVDAAAYFMNSTLSLKEYQADFIAFSFYKMFGFPTGVGALCASRDALELLKRPYSGGGTFDSIAWDAPWKVLKPAPAMYEDGTLPFLEIMAIDHGFNFIDSIGGWQAVQSHVFGLAKMAKQGFYS
jgi:molybdenum cofactor sulfurtransferase